MKIKNICVYCGSNSGRIPIYMEQAKLLAKELVERGIGLIYGGANVGLMGTLANAVLAEGGEVTGVIPEALLGKEIAHKNLTDLKVTKSMHERKTLMSDLSDGFIALPGGIGTLEELFEMWTWAQLGFHTKPCGLLNTQGYYDKLRAFLEHTVKEGFVKPAHQSMLIVESESDALLDRFMNYAPPLVEKWIGRKET